MQQFQELAHGNAHNYREASPHLKHWNLYDQIVRHILNELSELRRRNVYPSLLDIGAGEGSFVEPVLAAGYEVAAVEMSRPAMESLRQRFGHNRLFSVYFDERGDLATLGGAKFGVIEYSSVLHHIPDYLTAIDHAISHHLAPGGAFISFQDPLWYDDVSRFTRYVSQFGYLWWRVSKGNYRQGIQTRMRRLRKVIDETKIGDMAEYHIQRQGVDHEQFCSCLGQVSKR